MTKDISAKTWLLRRNYDGTLDSRYPGGDKPGGSTVVAPTLGTPGMGSTTAVIPFTGGANYTTLIPQYQLDGASSWTSLPSDIVSPLNFTGLATGEDYLFRALADGDVNLASNVVAGTTVATATDRSQLAFWLNADARTTGQPAGTNDATHPGWYGDQNNGIIVVSSNPYPGKTKSVRINFPANDEWQQGFFIEDLLGQLGFRAARYDTLWMSFRIRPAANANWRLNSSENLKWCHFRQVGGRGLYTLLVNDTTGTVTFDNDELVGGTLGQIPMASGLEPPPEVWTTIEMCAVLDTVPVSQGGQAQMRFYQNGQLAWVQEDRLTIGTDLVPMNEVRWLSNWNGGGPINSFEAEIDDFCIAAKIAGVRDDTPHMATDAYGNKYIGM